MWLENGSWGIVALDEVGEVGRGQIKQDFGLCWVPLNQAMSKDFKCKESYSGSRKVR